MPVGSLIKTIAVYDTPFWRDQGLNGQVTCTDLPVGAIFDASPASGKPGVMLGFIDGDQARALDDASDAARASAAIKSYTAFFGKQAASPRMYFDQVWAREIYTGGCPVGIMPPGVLTEYGAALRAPVGPDPLGRHRDRDSLERLHGRCHPVRQAGRRRGAGRAVRGRPAPTRVLPTTTPRRSSPMATVREATFELLRAHGMTTIFGNPGSTELPMLADFPDDFSYVLGLQELVVVGMADGYAQATGRPTHVNLHTAPGVGNAVGGIFNAQANKSPLVITAGQQVRPQMTFEANLTNRDAVVGPQPYVKCSHEPPRAQDVPAAVARAIHHAMLPPRGPAFVSIPMDDWTVDADEDRSNRARERGVTGRTAPDPEALTALAGRLAAARSPVLIAGPDIDAAGGWDAAVALAEKQRLPVWASPATGGSRLGFPEGHPQFVGVLPPAVGPIAETLKEHDLVLVVGSSVFPYYPYIPGPLLAPDSALVQITSDPGEAARAPMGDAILGDVGLALARLVELVPAEADREVPPAPAGARRPLTGRSFGPAQRIGGDGGAGRRVERRCHRGASRRPRARWPCATGCGSRARAATTSAPAAASASGSRRRLASSWPSPSVRWCACSARARRSTASPPCGARSPIRHRSRSWCSATTST